MKPLGIKGEDIASSYLRKKGYRIICRNYKTPFGEMDIIAEHKGTIVFVEVKTRASESVIKPFEAVDWKKKEKIKKVALQYISALKREPAARFDVVGITMGKGKEVVEHIVDAFEISP